MLKYKSGGSLLSPPSAANLFSIPCLKLVTHKNFYCFVDTDVQWLEMVCGTITTVWLEKFVRN